MSSPTNPYIIGRPIDEPNLFFGRESLFQDVEDNLKQGVKVILLEGQRRIGKSSVIFQIHNFVDPNEFVFVPFDLHDKSRLSLSEVLYRLAAEIITHLLLKENIIQPSIKDLQRDKYIFSIFLNQVCQALSDKKLVLLLDEFDVLNNYNPDSALEHFFPYLLEIVPQQKQLFIIPVVGRRLDEMPKLLSLFRAAPNLKIGLLDETSTERLITKPADGVLQYQLDAIQRIIELSAGHPYFTQTMCFSIFGQARDKQKWIVNREDVDKIIDKAIEIGEPGLTWFWDGLPIPERVVFSAVAEAQKNAASKSELFVGEPLVLLKEYGVVQTESLAQAGERLVEWGYLDFAEEHNLRSAKFPTYKVKVELVRQWLVKRHPLRREIWDLENLEEEASRIYEIAAKLGQRPEMLTSALNIYEQVLVINPNHFRTLLELAEAYQDAGDFGKAIEKYTRAYQVDPIRTQEGFATSLLNYGYKFLETGNSESAKQQFKQVLKIDPNNALAQAKLKEIEDYKEKEAYKEKLNIRQFFNACNPSRTLRLENTEDRKYYIDFSSVVGGNVIEALSRTITRISPDKPTCQLFTGHIGCGKSTELLRLKYELELQGFHVVYFESSQDLDMADVDVSDILLAIARQVSQSLEENRITLNAGKFSNMLKEVAELLQTPIELSGAGDISTNTGVELSLPFGIGKITARTKDSPRLRSQLRQYLEPRISGILEAINNDLLKPGIQQLKRQGKKGLVVIVDNLDRIDNSIKSIGRSQPEYLFLDRGEQLKQLNCHIVYTIPLVLLFSSELARLTNRFGGVEPEVLPMVPVQLPNGNDCEEGMVLLRQMVLARAFPDISPEKRLNLITQVFDNPETLDRLCRISGGHVRNLLGLLYRCIQQEDPPLSRECLEKVIMKSRNSLMVAVTDAEWELLRKVRQQNSVGGREEYQILLRSLFVFEYQYKNLRWFNINPILAEAREIQS